MNARIGGPLARAAMAGSLVGSLLVGGAAAPVSAAGCLATGAVDRDGTALTARIIDPARPVTGRVDATGCEVGVYFSSGHGKVAGADVFGARYYGVLVDGNGDGHTVSVDVRGSRIHDIGETPMTSSRHGQGIAYRGFGGTATGKVSGNRVWGFQEAGINMTGPGSTVTAIHNVVTGRGVTDVISQNGIQVIFGAHGIVRSNVIRDLRYTGPNVANGIIVVGGPGYHQPYTRDARIEGNHIVGADVGINVFEIEDDNFANIPSVVPTRILITRNVVRNDALTNHEGWADGVGFQAGIADFANSDRIVSNIISGAGYDPAVCGADAVCAPIFTDGSIDPFVSGNVLR
ncbi:MAG: right-handed parallel beta-helix repeat-containing protein [Chloroflexi bacterium]|nr:right-handed parallel beta-helix repeat-containing protein [Chloroflexota bacterium]